MRPATPRNSTEENFDVSATAVASPSNAAVRGDGASSQRCSSISVAAIPAVTAMSVVASPACASTGGRFEYSSAASTAAHSPPSIRACAHTTTIDSRKNGRMPARASDSMRRYGPLCRISFPCSVRPRSRGERRAPAAYGPIALATRASGGCCGSPRYVPCSSHSRPAAMCVLSSKVWL